MHAFLCSSRSYLLCWKDMDDRMFTKKEAHERAFPLQFTREAVVTTGPKKHLKLYISVCAKSTSLRVNFLISQRSSPRMVNLIFKVKNTLASHELSCQTRRHPTSVFFTISTFSQLQCVCESIRQFKQSESKIFVVGIWEMESFVEVVCLLDFTYMYSKFHNFLGSFACKKHPKAVLFELLTCATCF